ncbi:hypothetical protein ACN47E_002908 [Coniothyrium glycines]
MASPAPVPVPAASPASKTYAASCHCSAFVYSVTLAPPLEDPRTEVMHCNCSICERNGYLFVYVPDGGVVFSKGGVEEFGAYAFGSRKMAHYFCKNCGSSCVARSTHPGFFDGMTCVNVRMLEGVEVKDLKLKPADGRSYVPEETAAAA